MSEGGIVSVFECEEVVGCRLGVGWGRMTCAFTAYMYLSKYAISGIKIRFAFLPYNGHIKFIHII